MKTVPLQTLMINRMMVDGVIEAPNGAHFTLAGDYGRDEKFQRHYAESARPHESWQQFVAHLPVRQRGPLPGRREEIRARSRHERDN